MWLEERLEVWLASNWFCLEAVEIIEVVVVMDREATGGAVETMEALMATEVGTDTTEAVAIMEAVATEAATEAMEAVAIMEAVTIMEAVAMVV